jgi:hypothetical protein
MKWFKHNTDSYSNLKMGAILDEFGTSAYGFWWICVELVGQQGIEYRLEATKGWRRALNRFSVNEGEIDRWLKAFGTINLIDAEALARGDLYIPNLSEYCDDYYSKSVRTISQKVRTISENVPLEEKRREEIRKEEKPTASLDWLTAISEGELKELSEKYEASRPQITRKAETMKNYCLSKGKIYKNYRAFLEGGLDKDFGRRIVVKAPEKEAPVILSADELARIDAKKKEISAMFKGV